MYGSQKDYMDNMVASAGMRGKVYWVDSVNGDSGNDALASERPLALIASAITLSNTDIALTANANKNNTIFIRGGDYDENITTGANNCDLIGLDACRSGWSPRLTGNIAISATMGMRLFNLEVQSDAAGTSCVKLSGTCFNFEMHNCEIRAPNDSSGKGFETAASSVTYYTMIENCKFTNAHYDAIYLGGAIKATRILNNYINARTSGIQTTNAGSVEMDSIVKDNVIFRSDNATETDLTYGIRLANSDRTPEIMIVHNWIAATNCISYAASETNYWQSLRCIDNHCISAADGGWDRISAA